MPDFVVITLNVILIATIVWRCWKRESSSIKIVYWPALLFKLCTGIGLGLLYKYYYESGDTFSLFSDATKLSSLARTNWQEYVHRLWTGDHSFPVWSTLSHHELRSVFFVKWISIFNLLTHDNYWLTSLYFSLISFFAAWYLVRKIIDLFPESSGAAVVSFLFFPSIIFWSSGVGKEALAIPGLLILTGLFLKGWHCKKISKTEWLLCVLALWCVWRLKYFYLALFIPIGITTLLTKFIVTSYIAKEKPGFNLLIWVGIFSVLLLGVSFLHPNFNFSYLPEVIVLNNREYNRISDPDNLIHFPSLKPDFVSLAINSPKAFFSGLFRPFMWEVNSILTFLMAIENLVLLLFSLSAIVRLKNRLNGKYHLITLGVLAYSLLLCVFLALSTPNFGTLVRYRIGFLPFLVFVLIYQNPLLDRLTKVIQRFYGHLVRKT